MLRTNLTLLSLALTISACAGSLPSHVEGSFPEQQPPIYQFYSGDRRPREKSALLVAAQNPDQTALYIIRVDNLKPKNAPKSGLIGGSLAANVLPGKHDVTLQFSDKGRITMPLKLTGLNVKANAGYLINFSANFPEDYLKDPYVHNDSVEIVIRVSSLDNNEIIREVTYNGFGQITAAK